MEEKYSYNELLLINKGLEIENYLLKKQLEGCKEAVQDNDEKSNLTKEKKEINEKLVLLKELFRNNKILAESETRFRSIFEQGYLVQLIINPTDGRIIDVNHAACSYYGYSKDEFLAKYVKDINIGGEEEINTNLCNASEQKQNYFQVKHKLSTGEIRDVEIFSTAIVFGINKYLFSIIIDISQRIKNEKEIQKKEELLRKAINALPIGVVLYTAENTIYSYNSKFTDLFGYTIDDVPTPNDWFILAYPDIEYRNEVAKRWDIYIQNYLQTGNRPHSFEAKVTCKNGIVLDIEFSFEAIGELYIATFVDVTPRNRAIKTIKENETRLKLAIHNAKEGTWDWNIQLGTIEVNDYWLLMLGYNPNELILTLDVWETLVFPADLSYAKAEIARHLNGETEEYKCEYRMVKKNGEPLWILDHGKIIEYDSKGKPLRALGTHVDINELKQNQKQLQDLNAELQALIYTKDRILSIIAHDLRSPFNAILGFTDLILDSCKENNLESVERYANIVLQSAKGCFDLLNNLLDWSKIQTGQFKINLVSFNFSTLVKDILLFFDANVKSKNQVLHCNIDEYIDVVLDVKMMETVVRNLVSNAIKFTPQNGFIQVTAKKMNSRCLFSVKDSGIGIKTENLEKIFKYDSGLSRLGTENEQGSGLGLVLCKEFVKLHNGNIQVDSRVGEGSVFTVLLPI